MSKLLDMIGKMDFLNPLDGAIGRTRNGPMHRFTFATGTGFTGKDAELVLRRYHIPIWGREMNDPTERAFLVKEEQAVWAEYVLANAGCPLTSKLLTSSNQALINQGRERKMPTPWGKGSRAHSFVARIVDLIG